MATLQQQLGEEEGQQIAEAPLTSTDLQDPKALAAKLRTSQGNLDELRKLAQDSKYNVGVPPDTSKSLQEAISGAERLYNQRANRNDWLEVAQSLSRAVTQYGAAQSGMRTGRDMSNLNMGPGIDYGARSDRAFRDYSQQVKNAQDSSVLQRQNYQDKLANSKLDYAQQSEPYSLGAKLASANELETERYGKAVDVEGIRDDRRAREERAREEREAHREEVRLGESDRKYQATDLKTALQGAEKKLQAAQAIGNQAATDDDLNSKSKNKIKEKYGVLAADAGIDPEALANIGEQSKDSGLFGTGFFTSQDPKKKSALIQEQVVKPRQEAVDRIREQLRALSTRQSTGKQLQSEDSNSTVSPPSQSKTSSGTVKMKAPNGQIGDIPEASVSAAEAKGFTRIQ